MQCQAQTKDWRPCPAIAVGSDGLCFFHSSAPDIVARRQAAKSEGGRARGRIRHIESLRSLSTPREQLRRIEELFNLLIAHELSPKVATAACKLLERAEAAYNQIVLETRLRAVLKAMDAGVPEIPATYIRRDGGDDGDD